MGQVALSARGSRDIDNFLPRASGSGPCLKRVLSPPPEQANQDTISWPSWKTPLDRIPQLWRPGPHGRIDASAQCGQGGAPGALGLCERMRQPGKRGPRSLGPSGHVRACWANPASASVLLPCPASEAAVAARGLVIRLRKCNSQTPR